MQTQPWIELAVFIVALISLTPLLGGYMARVFSGQLRFLGAIERAI